MPLRPMSTIVSPLRGSHLLSGLTSIHSKLLLVDKDTTTTISSVSLPVIFSFPPLKGPVTTHEPGGMGDVASIGLTTVVAPCGAWPEVR